MNKVFNIIYNIYKCWGAISNDYSEDKCWIIKYNIEYCAERENTYNV